jgi:cyclic pyranopterin phosphate synthase
MIKAVDPAARIDDIRVLRKEGGKTGVWTRG